MRSQVSPTNPFAHEHPVSMGVPLYEQGCDVEPDSVEVTGVDVVVADVVIAFVVVVLLVSFEYPVETDLHKE